MDRLLLAIDDFDSSRQALRLAIELAGATGARVRVLHVRELAPYARIPAAEDPATARMIVHEAVVGLRLAGVTADGAWCTVRSDRVATRILDEAAAHRCDAIVLGSRRLRGVDRLAGRGVRERVLRHCNLTVITASAGPEENVRSAPGVLGSVRGKTEEAP